jgi:hypothetical protein
MTATTAHNVTAALRTTLETDIAALTARLADIAATGISTAEQFRVLYADCGMVVQEAGGVYRLGDTSEGMAAAFKAHLYEAQAVADAWNARLTREQMVSRCWVQVLPLATALERAIEEKEALLDALAKG